MAKDFSVSDINIEQLRADFNKKPTATKTKYTIPQISEILVKHGGSILAYGTLSKMSKADLFDILINGDKEPKAPKSKTAPTTSEVDSAESLLSIANSIKKHIHGVPLTEFTHEQGSKAIESVIEKVNAHDENIMQKMGWAGIAFGGAVIAIDTIIGLENVADMAKTFLGQQEQPKEAPQDKKAETHD